MFNYVSWEVLGRGRGEGREGKEGAVSELNKFLSALSCRRKWKRVTGNERNVLKFFGSSLVVSSPRTNERAYYLCNAVLSIYHNNSLIIFSVLVGRSSRHRKEKEESMTGKRKCRRCRLSWGFWSLWSRDAVVGWRRGERTEDSS